MTSSRLHHLVPVNSVAAENSGGPNGSMSSSSDSLYTEDEGALFLFASFRQSIDSELIYIFDRIVTSIVSELCDFRVSIYLYIKDFV